MSVIQTVDRMLNNLNSLLMDDTDSVQIHSHNISESHTNTHTHTHTESEREHCKKCFPYLAFVFWSCFQSKYLKKILKSRIFTGDKSNKKKNLN